MLNIVNLRLPRNALSGTNWLELVVIDVRKRPSSQPVCCLGPIPTEIGLMPKLTMLDVYGNQLTGAFEKMLSIASVYQ